MKNKPLDDAIDSLSNHIAECHCCSNLHKDYLFKCLNMIEEHLNCDDKPDQIMRWG